MKNFNLLIYCYLKYIINKFVTDTQGIDKDMRLVLYSLIIFVSKPIVKAVGIYLSWVQTRIRNNSLAIFFS